MLGGEVIERITADDRGAAISRIPLVHMSLHMIAENPVLGVGANNYIFALEKVTHLMEFRNVGFVYVAHCKYLVVWVETGIVGLSAFLVFLILSVNRGWYYSRTSDPLLGPLALGLTAGMLGTMVHMFSENVKDPAILNSLFIVGGLIVAIGSIMAHSREAAGASESCPT